MNSYNFFGKNIKKKEQRVKLCKQVGISKNYRDIKRKGLINKTLLKILIYIKENNNFLGLYDLNTFIICRKSYKFF